MQEHNIYTPHHSKVAANGCISIIGMAAAGKSTIGRELARLIDWPHVDTDHIIESVYGVRLQQIADRMDKERFLDLEDNIVSRINLKRILISTGGSVVYRDPAMLHLASLGPVIYIEVPLPIILERIARKPERGLAINPGQTIEDLYNERRVLYEKYSTFKITGGAEPATLYARNIAEWLEQPV